MQDQVGKLAIIGCGTMGKAILSGLIESGVVGMQNIKCLVGSEESAKLLQEKFSSHSSQSSNSHSALSPNGSSDTVLDVQSADNDESAAVQLCKWADIVLICTKPHIARQMFEEDIAHGNGQMVDALVGKMLISVCSGLRIVQFRKWLPKTVVIRAMPNTPCKIRQGMTVISTAAHSNTTSVHKKIATTLFQPLGRIKVLDEKHMDACTSLSGSGPAFACVMMEALADGAVMMGLSREVALELAACAMKGAAEMYLKTGKHPSELKDEVITPGGCTIAGILCLEDGKVRSTIARAVQEAAGVAGSLGNRPAADSRASLQEPNAGNLGLKQ
ncbi:hypothetical protein MP228_012502 [Amoeboaphelidium protococcarum]|nr:hypothetical protein MP228_012502 [Amoeboaphelidium protococcarum]